MSYWELETEAWELEPDNYDGARWMTMRGRRQFLEKSFSLEYKCEEYD